MMYSSSAPNKYKSAEDKAVSVDYKFAVAKAVQYKPQHGLPDCIIIGSQKCGTSALITMLADLHPNIKATPKETHFFDTANKLNKGLIYYKNMLPVKTSERDVIIEKTPQYFIVEAVPGRILQSIPRCKFILLVSDPVIRTMSGYLHDKAMTAKGGWKWGKGYMRSYVPANMTFREHVTFSNSSYNSNVSTIYRSEYARHMKRWLDIFPRDRFLVLNGQDLVANPYPLLKKVEKYLELPPVISQDSITKVKQGNWEYYCWYKKDKTSPTCLDKSKKGREHKQESEDVISWLREYFVPWNEKFFDMIGERFHWEMTMT